MKFWTERAQRHAEASDAVYGEFIATLYDGSWYGRTSDAETAFYRAIIDDGIALELGCGTGRLSIPLLDSGVDLYGLEYSEPMLERLQRKLDSARQQRFIQWDSRVCPYPIRDNSVDTVIVPFSTFAVLHNGPAPILDNRILHEIHRVLVPHGTVVINDLRIDAKPSDVPAADEVEHAATHPTWGAIRESWSGVYSCVATATIPRQIVRKRSIKYVHADSGAVLHTGSDFVPVWYPMDFPVLAAACGFRYLSGDRCDFYEYPSINHFFERLP
jgi:SAM-dependent methyltransferase